MTKSVLLVEDEDSIAMALEFMVNRLGCRMRRATSSAEAMAAIREEAPDLVLLDVMLKEGSGFEVCQAIRLDPELDRTRILMMTARGGDAVRRKGMALGADMFVAKPFSLADLRSKVRDLLDEQPA